MATGNLVLALISDVFHDAEGVERLAERLAEAKRLGASLALLPELPLNPWSPATRRVLDEDAEPPNGARHRIQSDAAREAEIGLVGGAIVRDAATGKRHNTALVFDASGTLISTYRKLHLPHEEGFWEADHYDPGSDPPSVIPEFGMPIGIQICSDANRPEGAHLLGALGAEAIFAPRATEATTFDRWRLVLRANAMTSAAYVVSVTRPRPEQGVPLGGPAIAIGPDGSVVLETTDPIRVIALEREAVRRAREDYPGYLAIRADVYAKGWSRLQ
jgi:predicted amidohydrolase